MVELDDIFPSVAKKDETVIGYTRSLPENWRGDFAQTVQAAIENSYPTILEEEGDGDGIDSYLEYSFTLTKEGIKKIRQYNDEEESNGGYLNETTKDCEYNEDDGIFYNCKSTFLELISNNGITSAYSGNDLVINNKQGSLGVSEFCSNINNSNQEYCKYQRKD